MLDVDEFIDCCARLRITEFDHDFDPAAVFGSIPNREYKKYMTWAEFEAVIAEYIQGMKKAASDAATEEEEIQNIKRAASDAADESEKSEEEITNVVSEEDLHRIFDEVDKDGYVFVSCSFFSHSMALTSCSFTSVFVPVVEALG